MVHNMYTVQQFWEAVVLQMLVRLRMHRAIGCTGNTLQARCEITESTVTCGMPSSPKTDTFDHILLRVLGLFGGPRYSIRSFHV